MVAHPGEKKLVPLDDVHREMKNPDLINISDMDSLFPVEQTKDESSYNVSLLEEKLRKLTDEKRNMEAAILNLNRENLQLKEKVSKFQNLLSNEFSLTKTTLATETFASTESERINFASKQHDKPDFSGITSASIDDYRTSHIKHSIADVVDAVVSLQRYCIYTYTHIYIYILFKERGFD